jgi:Xaa-Pro aminopeptidase
VRAAAAHTAELFSEATRFIRPGLTERAIAKFFHARMEEWKVQPAWELAGCPIVNAGPESEPGHAAPGDLVLRPGQILHVDFGIKENEYCSDLQRIWYVLRPGEKQAPAEIQRAVDAVVRTIQESARVLRPGVAGWQVDARAREVITGAGFPEYQHALGHQLGRIVHDGSTLLGPHWERYGDTPDGIVEENQIYTLELGAATSAGFVGLEEDVLVTASGVEWLSTPQTAPFLVGGD